MLENAMRKLGTFIVPPLASLKLTKHTRYIELFTFGHYRMRASVQETYPYRRLYEQMV